MSAIGKAIEGLAHDVGQAVEGVAKGIGGVVKGGTELVEGALTLNPKKMGEGLGDAVGGALKTGTNLLQLTPEGLEASAANHLLDGALGALGDTGMNSGLAMTGVLAAQDLVRGEGAGLTI
ncbi:MULTISPECIES: hypothetical protein [unclassified Paraburkholderia]|uniref:hypothetical protein n=1 Tax=unclassified Paraburkholderia TaxID=2615204 RepID=UPI002AAF5AEC|nr:MULTISPECIES: hypothetical protein [unclassified Paraburkholderia]